VFKLEENWERSGDEIFYLVERSPTPCLPPRVQVVQGVGARGGAQSSCFGLSVSRRLVAAEELLNIVSLS
jgi:hypothetical protein